MIPPFPPSLFWLPSSGVDIATLRNLGQGRESFSAQIEELIWRTTRDGKPYWELKLRDASGSIALKAWNDSPAFAQCSQLRVGEAVEIQGDFQTSLAYGMEAKRWSVRKLSSEEREAFFAAAASPTLAKDWDDLTAMVDSVADPRLQGVSRLFLNDFGERFKRCAAARAMHHARRGGLLQHVAQMARAADALCPVYPELRRDLLLAGVLFHDCGKLWETCPPEEGFVIPPSLRGELLGHISIGIEIVNALWRRLDLDHWRELEPASEDVRLHLLHLIASHHGTLEFGSPVLPKTPEAVALHYLDNLDARLEMFQTAYANPGSGGPMEFVKGLGTAPVRQLG